MRVLEWNVAGVSNKEAELHQLLLEAKPDLCILTETWLTPGQEIPSTWKSYQVTEQRKPGRPAGGVAVLMPAGRCACVVRRFIQDGLNAIWLRQENNVDIIATYIRPNAAKEELQKFLQDVHSKSRYPVLLVGDLNCRSTTWCTTTNRNGRILKKWASSHRFQIHAPRSPTFATKNGRSTVDIFAARNVEIIKPVIVDGPWTAASDHVPVLAVTTSTPPTTRCDLFTTRLLIDKNNKEKAAAEYSRTMPRYAKLFDQAPTIERLNTAYEQFVECIKKPWREARGKRPPTFRPNWDQRIEKLSKQRYKVYKKARRTNSKAVWDEHASLDKEIKNAVRRKKRQQRKRQIKTALENPDRQIQAWLKKEIRHSAASAARSNAPGQPLDAAEFTTYMQTPTHRSTTVVKKGFGVSKNFKNTLLEVIQKLPRGTAAGKDALYYEMFQAEPSSSAEALTSLWRACGRLKEVPSTWNEGLLVPLHKKGDTSNPANYRPICLLSAARKVLERAIDRALQKQFQPHLMQVGFQACLSTDIAILLTQDAIVRGQNWAAILDLMKAYDSVPRDKLLALCEKELDEDTTGMVTHLLQPLSVFTAGDNTETSAVVSLGVPQGGPVSPSLFNIYMNPLAVKLTEAIWKPGKPLPGRFYADDVILLLSELWELLLALRVCEEWANEFSMSWSLNKKKSQLLLHPNIVAIIGSLPFAGGQIHSVPTARYLGITLTSKGISASSWDLRTASAHRALQNLSAAKLIFPGVDPGYARTVFRVFIQSTLDYISFATPVDNAAVASIEPVYARFFAMALGIRVRPKQCNALRLLFRMDDRETRNEWLALTFRNRIARLAHRENQERSKARTLAKETLIAINRNPTCRSRETQAGGLPINTCRRNRFQTIAASMKRPIAHQTKWPIALCLKNSKLRSLAVKWHLGVFPTNPRLLERIGFGHTLRDLKLLSKAQLSKGELRTLIIALETTAALASDTHS